MSESRTYPEGAAFAFTGTIERVVINTKGSRYVDPEGEARRAMLHQ